MSLGAYGFQFVLQPVNLVVDLGGTHALWRQQRRLMFDLVARLVPLLNADVGDCRAGQRILGLWQEKQVQGVGAHTEQPTKARVGCEGVEVRPGFRRWGRSASSTRISQNGGAGFRARSFKKAQKPPGGRGKRGKEAIFGEPL